MIESTLNFRMPKYDRGFWTIEPNSLVDNGKGYFVSLTGGFYGTRDEVVGFVDYSGKLLWSKLTE